MENMLFAHFCVFLANFFFGINYPIAKDVMAHGIGAMALILLRVLIPTTLFWFIHFFAIKERIHIKDIPTFILSSLFGVMINQPLFFKGIHLTTPIDAAIIMTIIPVFVLGISTFLGQEKLTLRKIIGMFFGLGGALTLVTYGKSINLNSEAFQGNILVLINALSYGSYLVVVQPLMKKYHPLTVIKWVFTFGCCGIVPLGYAEFKAIDWQTMPLPIMLKIGFVVIFTTFLAYLLNLYALQRLPSSVVGIYVYLHPIVAAIASLILGRDIITTVKVVAALCIFFGVYLVSIPSKKPLRAYWPFFR